MARRIQVLPDTVANQIAAGEVVERPASVVKELVENALDARAKRIDVVIERGGKTRIRVADDGVGMGREDALLSLDRHATSKITDAGDLRAIRSLGFRGEALPSIAAVSRMELETRERDDEVGTRVRTTGGRILGVEDTARRTGTTVIVSGLFFNAPARAKFLKSVAAEARAVSEVLTTLALAHPGVALSLDSDGRRLLELPASSQLADRVARLWGDDVASTLLPVAASVHGVEVHGLAQRPDAAGPGARRAQLFVTGRPFKDPGLIAAAQRGYRTTLPSGVRPRLLLYLGVGEGEVDVNVHPAKAEVRFRERGPVEEAVEAAVRLAMADIESAATFDHPESGAPALLGEPRVVREPGVLPGGGEDQMALFLARAGAAPDGPEAEVMDDLSPLPPGRPHLAQLHRTYILTEARDGLLIIDQHSAHERILFERLMKAYADGGQEAQRLLFPLTVRLSPEECAAALDVQGILRSAGFEVEPFGTDTLILHAVPNPHPWFDAERCFREMVTELAEGTSDLMRAAKNQHERIAMTFACKSAIRAGHALAEAEMHELFDALFATELPWHDVHGRPTVVRLSAAELARKFGRE